MRKKKMMKAPSSQVRVRKEAVVGPTQKWTKPTVELSGHEQISSLSLGSAPAFQVITDEWIYPTNTSIFQWLAQVSSCFEKYYFKKLEFRFTSTTATVESGSVAMCFSLDTHDPTPTSMQQMSLEEFQSFSSVRESFILRIPSDRLRDMRFTYGSDSDMRLTSCGSFTMASEGISKLSGVLEVFYTIVLVSQTFPEVGPNAYDFQIGEQMDVAKEPFLGAVEQLAILDPAIHQLVKINDAGKLTFDAPPGHSELGITIPVHQDTAYNGSVHALVPVASNAFFPDCSNRSSTLQVVRTIAFTGSVEHVAASGGFDSWWYPTRYWESGASAANPTHSSYPTNITLHFEVQNLLAKAQAVVVEALPAINFATTVLYGLFNVYRTVGKALVPHESASHTLKEHLNSTFAEMSREQQKQWETLLKQTSVGPVVPPGHSVTTPAYSAARVKA